MIRWSLTAAGAGCTAPIFVSILLQGAAAGPTGGAAITLAYGVGMATVMVVLTLLTALVGPTLVSTLSAYTDRIYRRNRPSASGSSGNRRFP